MQDAPLRFGPDPMRQSARSRLRRDCRRLDRICLAALGGEACAWPKPGLVTPRDAGSHRDMSIDTLRASTEALEGCFGELALAGALGAGFGTLAALGVEAEAAMTRATGGVNTHRGAIFHLGLLAAATGRRHADSALGRRHCGAVVASAWGTAIASARLRAPASHGHAAFLEHGAGGARGEAARGFPSVYRVGLPLLRDLATARASNDAQHAGVLMAIVEHLRDTNLLWRGGTDGLAFARRAAAAFNRSGGVLRPGWRDRLMTLHQRFVERRLSPGGAADLLSATLAAAGLERFRFTA